MVIVYERLTTKYWFSQKLDNPYLTRMMSFEVTSISRESRVIGCFVMRK